MYLVCKPCSSLSSWDSAPSTSCLYFGLIAIIIITVFCKGEKKCFYETVKCSMVRQSSLETCQSVFLRDAMFSGSIRQPSSFWQWSSANLRTLYVTNPVLLRSTEGQKMHFIVGPIITKSLLINNAKHFQNVQAKSHQCKLLFVACASVILHICLYWLKVWLLPQHALIYLGASTQHLPITGLPLLIWNKEKPSLLQI